MESYLKLVTKMGSNLVLLMGGLLKVSLMGLKSMVVSRGLKSSVVAMGM